MLKKEYLLVAMPIVETMYNPEVYCATDLRWTDGDVSPRHLLSLIECQRLMMTLQQRNREFDAPRYMHIKDAVKKLRDYQFNVSRFSGAFPELFPLDAEF